MIPQSLKEANCFDALREYAMPNKLTEPKHFPFKPYTASPLHKTVRAVLDEP